MVADARVDPRHAREVRDALVRARRDEEREAVEDEPIAPAHFGAGSRASDGGEVTFFKITSITNGSLFQNDGTTPINNNDFITVAQGGAGLKFTPAPNFFGNGSFQVAGATDNSGGGLGSAATATITVNAVADTPSITPTTTNEDTQSTTGLVISRNAADSTEVTHFKITGITNGTLFQNDGVTPIANNAFITFAQANTGLKFTPAANFFGNGSFNVQSSLSNSAAGLGGGLATATITVSAVADTPSVTNAATNEAARSPVIGSPQPFAARIPAA